MSKDILTLTHEQKIISISWQKGWQGTPLPSVVLYGNGATAKITLQYCKIFNSPIFVFCLRGINITSYFDFSDFSYLYLFITLAYHS